MITILIGGSASSWPVIVVVPAWFMGVAGAVAVALIIAGVAAGVRWLTAVGLTLAALSLAVTGTVEALAGWTTALIVTLVCAAFFLPGIWAVTVLHKRRDALSREDRERQHARS